MHECLKTEPLSEPEIPPMKRLIAHLVAATLIIPALAISFALPTFAQQKETLDARAVEKADPLAGKFNEAVNNNDPAAIAALFAEDAVFVTPDKSIVGPQAIEKQYVDWFQGGRHSNHTTTYDSDSYQITGTTDTITLSGGWSETVEVQGKPQEFTGRWLAVDVRGSDGWKIWKLAFNLVPAPVATTASAEKKNGD
jgi:uncharacterized protein (TIGR02246 family)